MSGHDIPVSDTDIAVVGMAGRFPGARDVEEFWRNIRDGVEAITWFSDEELRAAGVSSQRLRDPGYVKGGFVLPDMDLFDAGFFGFNPREAAIMDPQHRHFLECAWSALEHAGHAPGSFEGSIGVFAGCGASTHLMFNLLPNPELVQETGFFLLRHTGNDKDFLATRVSYAMNLRGPSVNVQTACSTSLVAVHMAAQSLLNGECDMALAGGATIRQPHRVGYVYKEGEIMSPDGHCRAFDAESKGTVFGSGVGVVVLRRLADALADGDTVHAVIRGSAINNDGSAKVGYLAPGVDGQARVIAEALAVAGLEPEEIQYVETHGTGTPVGDPIEVAALTQAFRARTSRTGFCGIGSVKTNIGHLDTAAGVASLIKTVQAIKHGEMPPSLHFDRPNPALELEGSPFFVNTAAGEWKPEGGRRRAGISALGAGGTNAHVILEEAPAQRPGDPGRDHQLLVLSARSEPAVETAAARLAEHLSLNPDVNLADVAFTLQDGRHAFEHRRILVAGSPADASAALETLEPGRVLGGRATEERRSVAFMFAGGGAQYPGMGADLYRSEPVFRAEIDRCLGILQRHVPVDLKRLMYPAAGDVDHAAAELERPSLALPALFATQYALARLWLSWGVEASAMIGHSMGEYTAATLAGVFSLEDALALVALRGRLFERVPEGGMLSVPLPVDELRPLLSDDLSIAAVNAPGLCVASGPVAALERLEARLAGLEVDSRRIHINIAAHSAMLEPILEEFGAFFGSVAMHAPEIPFVSNVTGTWLTAEEATSARYWVSQLRNTVRFAEGVGALLADPGRVLLEVGPGRTLATLARQHPEGAARQVFTSIRHPEDAVSDVAFLLGGLGQLWLSGVEIDWRKLHAPARRRRLPLPTYPFERQRYWIEPPADGATTGVSADEKRDDIGTWSYQVSWKRSLAPTPDAEDTSRRVLAFADEDAVGLALVDRLLAEDAEVILVTAGPAFAVRGPGRFQIRPGARADYDALIATLQAQGGVPQRIAHLWNLAEQGTDAAAYARVRDRAFYSLLFLAQALGGADVAGRLELSVVSAGMQRVAGEDRLEPMKAMLLGPTKVVPSEYPDIRARSIDIPHLSAGSPALERALRQVAREILAAPADEVIAYRGADRWVQSVEPLPLPPTPGPMARVRDGGVYLITGGLGGLGLLAAEQLARAAKVRLVLVSRSAFPARSEWEARVALHGALDRRGRTITKLLELEGLGAEVDVARADVTDAAAMRELVRSVRDRHGAVNGVIHAAGALADGLIAMKAPESAESVLAPKVLGTLALHEALRDERPDFVLLFSSRGALAGVAGQVDYAAANAVLDAFAHARVGLDDAPYVSINWSAWQDIGMTAVLPERPAAHPLLDRCITETTSRAVYGSRLSTRTHWLLDEHRIAGGKALIPGTGYLELARGAFDPQPNGQGVELRDVFFIAPFVVASDEEREIRVTLTRSAGGHEWVVSGSAGVDPQGRAAWEEHARGAIAYVDRPAERLLDLDAIRSRCSSREQIFTGEESRLEHLRLGPRWANLRRVRFGETEALATLELPASFTPEVDQLPLHPALLDVATACAQSLIPGFDGHEDFYVPISYGRVRAWRGLGPRCYSHIRYQPDPEGGKELAVFDVTIMDPEGRELVAIEDFTMMRVEDRASLSADSHGGDAAMTVDEEQDAEPAAEGILPEEGMEALRRIMAADAPPQVVVSPQDLPAYLARVRTAGTPRVRGVAAPPVDTAPVEEALRQHESIAEAAVVARQDRPGAVRITAYLVYTPGSRPTVSEMRRFLRQSVAEDLVPQHLLELDRLPRLDDGEIDRGALPDPFAPVDDYVAPRTEMERALAETWRQLLGVERVGIHDNFLDIGGHSLLAMRVIARFAKQTGIRLSPSALNLQTVEQIAADCERKSGPAADGDGAAAPTSVPEEAAPAARGMFRFLGAVRQSAGRS